MAFGIADVMAPLIVGVLLWVIKLLHGIVRSVDRLEVKVEAHGERIEKLEERAA